MNILVTGSNGQLGQSIKHRTGYFPTIQFIYTDFEDLDITNYDSLKSFLEKNNIDVLINCAGYTAVDKAESEPEKAFLINDHAVKNLAVLSNEFDFFLVHISTDYVFDGKKAVSYLESDNPNPLSTYGLSKLKGENAVFQFAKNAVILRTSWLYSEFGNNFVKTIRRLAQERPELKIVDDQIGTPTYAGDLAEIIMKVLAQKSSLNGTTLYHYSNEGIATWYDFANAIVELDNLSCKVTPIPTSEYPLPAIRPLYSVLSKEKIKKEFDIHIPDWKESLKKCIDNMNSGL